MSRLPECRPALKNAWTRLYVIIYFHFLAALHGHSCILLYTMTLEQGWHSGAHIVCVCGAAPRGQTLSELSLMPHRKCVHSMSQNKSTRPTHEILLSVVCIDAYCRHIFWYIWKKTGDIKSLDIFGVEKQCVYQIIVTLSCSLKISQIFLEELYNIPTDLMFHWKNIYKF